MAFKMFGRRRDRRKIDADLIEMGPVKEEPPKDPPAPGQPVPFEASLWLKQEGEGGSVYQRGAADMASPMDVEREHELGKLIEPEEVHVLQIPDQDRAPPTPSIACPGCGFSMTMPWGRPVVVTCSKCGTTRTIR